MHFQNFSGFFFVFVNMAPYGSQNIKTLPLQITFESFQTISEFSSEWSWQKYCFRFFTIFFRIYMGQYASQNFKTLLLPQITLESFQTFELCSTMSAEIKICPSSVVRRLCHNYLRTYWDNCDTALDLFSTSFSRLAGSLPNFLSTKWSNCFQSHVLDRVGLSHCHWESRYGQRG